MALEALKPGYLSYLNGEACDDLNRPFDDSCSSMPSSTAFREHLQALIDSHLASDVAGKSAAELVEELPYDGNFGYRDALIGLHILRETKAALDALLDDDQTLRDAVRDDGGETDAETDSAVREAAKQYDLDTRKDELDRIAREGARGFGAKITEGDIRTSIGEASSEDIAGSALNDDRPKEQLEVRLYEDEPKTDDAVASTTDRKNDDATCAGVGGPQSQERPKVGHAPAEDRKGDEASCCGVDGPQLEDKPKMEPLAQTPHAPSEPTGAATNEPNIAEKTTDAGGMTAESKKTGSSDNPAMALFGEEPSRIKIDHPDFKGAPTDVFRRAKEWLRDHIIAVAVGTRTKEKYPRIAPLIAQTQDPEFSITAEEVRKLVGGIRRRFSMLRFSKGKFGDDDFFAKMDRDGDGGPRDELFGMMGDMMDMLGGMRDGRKKDDEPSFTPWNDEGGGFQESDGESWK